MIVVAHHKVKDFTQWKPFYDQDINRRKENGIKDLKIGRKTEDPNDIYMIWEVDNAEKIKKMIESPDLKKFMEKAGVINEPEILLTLKD